MYRKGVFSFLLLLLLAACGESHEQMLRQLEELERMNRADSVMQNDTLALQLVQYFDRHGDANERMRAHYILGRTYADMGEAPAALNSYLNAAECADTAATNCDYHTLSRVYGQMAKVFYLQNLMEDNIKACDRAAYYAWKDCDTMQALNLEAHKTSAFNWLKQYDKVITSFDALLPQLQQTYGLTTAAKYCLLPVNSFLEKSCFEKAKKYIDLYIRESGYCDSDGNIVKGREVCYYYTGKYYLLIHQLDSAEYYFRKELQTGLDYTNQSMASRGLSLVFSENGPQDSAIKYALYSYEMNDSVYAQMSTKEVEQAKASYDYTRHQLLAEKEARLAERESKKAERILYITLFIVVFGGYLFYYLFKQKRIRDKAYQAKAKELEHATREILILRSQAEKLTEHISSISQRTEELEDLRSNETRLRQMIAQRELSLESLQAEYEKLRNHVKRSQTDREGLLEMSPIYASLHRKVDAGKKLSDEDFSQLYRLLREVLPGFSQFITNKKYSLNESEFNTCVLFRLHVKAFGAGVLLGKSPAAITKISKSVMMKLFQENGNSRELIEKLQAICE